jgi:hypothetical protein
MPDEAADESATALHLALLEVLKQLNRAELEEEAGEGLEETELLTLLRKGPMPSLASADLDRALATLVANGMAQVLDSQQYAWDRGRTLGRRFTVTLAGKQYLIGQLQKTGRVD